MSETHKALRYRISYFFLRITIGWVVRLMTHFSYDPCRIKSPCFLLLANHTNDLDPCLCVIGTKRHMRFVASANIMYGFGGRIVKFLADPIPRPKGASADETVALIEASLRQGESVAMFPEGNKTWNGETGFISKRTAVLVKNSGSALVTYRLTGGYLQTPRWGTSKRNGPMHGAVVKEYSPEELASMTVDQVYDAICSDLYVNACEEQRKDPKIYRSSKSAEAIEGVLYCCPKCGEIGTIVSKGSEFTCRCGLKGIVDEYGFLKGDLPYDNILDWDRHQREYIKNNAQRLKNYTEPISLDPQAKVTVKGNGRSEVLSENAAVFIFGDRIKIRDISGLDEEFLLKDISNLSAFRNNKVFFTCRELYIELSFAVPVSGLKYFALWRILTDREYV